MSKKTKDKENMPTPNFMNHMEFATLLTKSEIMEVLSAIEDNHNVQVKFLVEGKTFDWSERPSWPEIEVLLTQLNRTIYEKHMDRFKHKEDPQWTHPNGKTVVSTKLLYNNTRKEIPINLEDRWPA